MKPFASAPAGSLAFKAHTALWSIAGLASALYVGWVTLGPSTLETGMARTDPHQIAGGRGHEAALTQLSGDVLALRGKVAASDDNTHALLGRVAALEEKSAFVAASAPPPPVAAPTRTVDSKLQVAPPAPRSSDITTGAILQRTAATPTPAIAVAPERMAPVTVTTTVLQTNEPPASPPKTALGLQLSTGPNLDSLRLNWSLLHERHRELLGPMQTRYRKVAGKPNAPYQLIAGPVRSQADAARICKALTGSGVSCRATTYSGEEL